MKMFSKKDFPFIIKRPFYKLDLEQEIEGACG